MHKDCRPNLKFKRSSVILFLLSISPIQLTPQPSPSRDHTKIAVIGVGDVGMAIVQTILTQDLSDELALIDAKPHKLRGEMLDLHCTAAFLPLHKDRGLC
ncbi:hypothetical protein ACJRO7_007336 [Eucalyptus globulus]|uniref:Lactate/malate dehydrogenase N-terminal domain-containing protein n=1 Tax=Eucalyptus globulus TaxID=34317 RepID=A0ABD3ILS3_EUCGL